jgi:AraC family transcriptional regulator
MRVLFESDLVQIVHWRCLANGAGLAAERHYASPAIDLGFAGASIVHWKGRSTQFDLTRAMIHQPGVTYSMSHPWGAGCRGMSIFLAPQLHEELRACLAPSAGGCEPLNVMVTPRVQLRAHCLVSALQAGFPLGTLEVERTAVALVRELLAARRGAAALAAQRTHTRSLHERCVTRACAVMQERYRESPDLRELAQSANVSPNHLLRLFQEQVGMTVHQYLIRLRLHAALDEISESTVDLSTLAHELGFSSHSHFSAAFHAAFGRPPSAVRSELRWLRGGTS